MLKRLGKIKCLVLPRKSARPPDMGQYGGSISVSFDDTMMYLVTAIGLLSGGSSTVHIYTQTIHRTTQ